VALASYRLAKDVVDHFVGPLDFDYHGSDQIITILSAYEFFGLRELQRARRGVEEDFRWCRKTLLKLR